VDEELEDDPPVSVGATVTVGVADIELEAEESLIALTAFMVTG
jgi:hypothetical protein